MKKRLLDLFCCGGGASVGYEQAGFEVVGVDINPQPNYKGNFVQSDAFEYLQNNWKYFDAVHASPPCQAYSTSSMQFRAAGKQYDDLIEKTRFQLIKYKFPWVIENVPGAPLKNPVTLCGSMFGIKTYRHRLFESNISLIAPTHPPHQNKNAKMGRMPKENEFIQYVGHFPGVKLVQDMTGLHHLGQKELAQSIPPQYTKHIGKQLLNYLSFQNQ